MKNTHKLAIAIAITASLLSCNNPKPDTTPVEPRIEQPHVEVIEEKEGVNINVDAENNKVGVKADGVDVNIDGKN